MKKLGVTVVPLDLHARPIGSDDRALIRRAVMPSHAVADFQSFGLVGCHDGMLYGRIGRREKPQPITVLRRQAAVTEKELPRGGRPN